MLREVSEQVAAEMSLICRASSHLVALSMMVRRYVALHAATGRGTTISTCTWLNRLCGMMMGSTVEVCCLETLARWQEEQSTHTRQLYLSSSLATQTWHVEASAWPAPQDVPLPFLVLDVEFQLPRLSSVRDWSGILAAIMEPVY